MSLKCPGKGKVLIKSFKTNKISIKHLHKKETFAGQKPLSYQKVQKDVKFVALFPPKHGLMIFCHSIILLPGYYVA